MYVDVTLFHEPCHHPALPPVRCGDGGKFYLDPVRSRRARDIGSQYRGGVEGRVNRTKRWKVDSNGANKAMQRYRTNDTGLGMGMGRAKAAELEAGLELGRWR